MPSESIGYNQQRQQCGYQRDPLKRVQANERYPYHAALSPFSLGLALPRGDAEGFEKPNGAQSMQPSEGQHPGQGSEQNKENQDDATVKAAKAISEAIFGHKLEEREKRAAGAAVHYAFGTVTGGLYGAVAELAPEVTTGMGLPFGAAFWLVADETAVPLLGLSKPPTEYPASTHAYALASHLVFGLTAEIVRRALRNAL